MYIVQWCDHEGNLQECEFTAFTDAKLEAAYLRQQYDGVEVKKAST